MEIGWTDVGSGGYTGLYINIFFNLSLRTTNLKKYLSDSIFQLSEKINKNYKNWRIIIQGSHYFQIRGRSDFSFRELTGRSGDTSGRSQLRLIETLFRDPSDVTLPKFSKQLKVPKLICSGFFLFITTLRTYIQCHIFISVYLDWSLAHQ